MWKIDLNADVGEGIGNDAQLLPLLSSCNIACGGHAGNKKTIMEVLAFAKMSSVKVGAHPSYPDPKNFGRHVINISEADLKASIKEQILLLKELTETSGQKLHHIKPHGALYNRAAVDVGTAEVIIQSILEIDQSLTLYVPYKSVIGTLAQGRLKTATEGFADRAYNEDYTLVSRDRPHSVLTEHSQITYHVLKMIKEKSLKTITGKILPFEIDTLCVHGDTEGALDIARNLKEVLANENVMIV